MLSRQWRLSRIINSQRDLSGEFPRPMRQMPQEYAPVPQPMMSWDYSSYVPLASRANGTNAPCDTLFLRDISVTEAQVQSVAASL
ncbi:hypothetical protein CYMTET_33078, partial [Cymbomonas tetramitiformis]